MVGKLGWAATVFTAVFSLTSTASSLPLRPLTPQETAEVEAVVVTARRIGVPVWRVTRGAATLILIADADVPRGGTWRPEALEGAIKGARSMFLPQLIRRPGADESRQQISLQREGLPRESISLDPELEARLNRATETLRIRGARTRNLRVLGRYIIVNVLGPDRRKEDGVSLATRVAKKHKVRRVPFRGFEGVRLSETVEAARAREVRCVQSAVELAEHAEDDSAERLTALSEPGVTVAVLPLWSLADHGKLLDALSQDLTVAGPRWRN